jgi:hypothetical protein
LASGKSLRNLSSTRKSSQIVYLNGSSWSVGSCLYWPSIRPIPLRRFPSSSKKRNSTISPTRRFWKR